METSFSVNNKLYPDDHVPLIYDMTNDTQIFFRFFSADDSTGSVQPAKKRRKKGNAGNQSDLVGKPIQW